MPQPNKLSKPQFPEMDSTFQQHYQQLIDTVNTLAGYNGEIVLSDHLNMGGKNVKNVGEPVDPTDVISSIVANGKYSASVLGPQLEAGASQPLKSYRQINNPSQREQATSWLNDLMSAPPSANNLFPTITNVSGGVSVSLPSGIFQFADKSTVRLQGRTDLLSLPAQYAISSLSVSGGVVTCNVAATGLVAGQIVTCVPGTNSSFAGTFILTSSASGGAVLQWQDPSASGTDSSGNIQVNGVYYYAVKKRRNFVSLFGPFSADTLQNRLQVNYDGFAIVAIVVLTASGGQVAQSGGGGSPIVGSPTAGSFF
jgi:hypothetical protein